MARQKIKNQVFDQVRCHVKAPARWEFWDQLSYQVNDQVREQIYWQLMDQIQEEIDG